MATLAIAHVTMDRLNLTFLCVLQKNVVSLFSSYLFLGREYTDFGLNATFKTIYRSYRKKVLDVMEHNSAYYIVKILHLKLLDTCK